MTSTTDLKLAANFPPRSEEDWRALVKETLKGAEFEARLVSRTADGLVIPPLSTRRTRGVTLTSAGAEFPQASLSSTGWEIATVHAGTARGSLSGAVREDVAGGAEGIVLVLEGGGINGLKPGGTEIEAALAAIPPGSVSARFLSGSSFAAAAAALDAAWDAHGLAPEKRRGSYGADPLGSLALGGFLPAPPARLLAEAARLAAKTQAESGVSVFLVNGHLYDAAGASEAQELAAVLATIAEILRTAATLALTPAAILPKVEIVLAAGPNQFLTLAKFRAARRLLWRLASACGASEAAMDIKTGAMTSWRMMTRRDPWTNILRTTVACAAAAMGGANFIAVLPYTWALGMPDSSALRLARNIQLVCREEANLARVADPAAGSFALEVLTGDLACKAWELFQGIEVQGGMTAALTSGTLQAAIAETAKKRAMDLAAGATEITGVSAFPNLQEEALAVPPWPQSAPPPLSPAVTAPPLALVRDAAPFEALRDAADAFKAEKGVFPRVFLASLGPLAVHNQRSLWVQNLLASGGIEALAGDGYATPDEAAAAFKTSGTSVACLSSSDDIYREQAEAAARALRAAGARHLLLAGHPGERESALRAAGIDGFLHAGQDRLATLTRLQAILVAETKAAGAMEWTQK